MEDLDEDAIERSLREVSVSSSVPEEGMSETDQEYAALLKASASRDFSAFVALDIVYVCGRDPLGRPIVVFVANRIPAKTINLEEFLLFILSLLDTVVKEEYVLVYVSHNVSKNNRPPFKWLKKAYRIFQRKYKKNIKNLYIIHPTKWIKVLFRVFKPFLSEKFWKKLVYVDDIASLFSFISPHQLRLPEEVFKVRRKGQKYLLFGVTIEEACQEMPGNHGGLVPRFVDDLVQHLRENAMDTVGIFRIPGNAGQVRVLKAAYEGGGVVELENYDIHSVGGLLKQFLRQLREPILVLDILYSSPSENAMVMYVLFDFFHALSEKSHINKMTQSNLAVVFGPQILVSPNSSPNSAVKEAQIAGSFVEALIKNWPKIKDKLELEKISNKEK